MIVSSLGLVGLSLASWQLGQYRIRQSDSTFQYGVGLRLAHRKALTKPNVLEVAEGGLGLAGDLRSRSG